jgi:hypothetical protein
MRQFERSLMLQTLDQHWRDHLANLDHLRQGIHLRGYAQKNPKQEYKRESFELFSDMLDRIKQDVVRVVLTVQVRTPEDVQRSTKSRGVQRQVPARRLRRGAAPKKPRRVRAGAAAAVAAAPFVRAARRWDATIRARAGVGKKYKHCHGRLAYSELLRSPARTASSDPHARPLHAASPDDLLPVAGRPSALRRAKIKSWQRDDSRCSPHSTPERLRPASSRRTGLPPRPCAVCRRHLAEPARVRALVVNAGKANAGTGGRNRRAEQTCAAVASIARLRAAQVLPFRPASSWSRCRSRDRRCAAGSRSARSRPIGGLAAASAIMTTDTCRRARRAASLSTAAGHGHRHRKGRRDDSSRHGDDARLHRDRSRRVSRRCCASSRAGSRTSSFNCATIDGDTSTNDSFVIVGHGKAAMAPIARADDPRLAPVRAR